MPDSTTIYVTLFDEGAPVWRPVSATKLPDGSYLLGKVNGYDPEFQNWQFLPGSRVLVRDQQGDIDGTFPAAYQAVEGTAYLGDFGIAGSKVYSMGRHDGNLTITLASKGYLHPKGAFFGLTFNNITALAPADPTGQVLYGICEAISPGAARQFRVMTTPSQCYLDFCATTYTVNDYAVGDEDIHDAQIDAIGADGTDVIVVLRSDGWKRPRGTFFSLVFKDATIILEATPLDRFLYGLASSTEESGKITYYFQAENDEPCLHIQAASLSIGD